MKRFAFALLLSFVSFGVFAQGNIKGNHMVCAGDKTKLTDAKGSGKGTWSSRNIAAATVEATGIVHGVAVGTSVITYAEKNITDTFTIIVNTHTPIVGEKGVCSGGTTELVIGNNGNTGSWSSSNTNVKIALSTNNLLQGFVTGVTTGTSVITYTAGGCINTITIVVNPSIKTPTSKLFTGTSTQLECNYCYGNSWSSSDQQVAFVDADGIVFGKKTGTAIIGCVVNGGCYITTTITVVSDAQSAVSAPATPPTTTTTITKAVTTVTPAVKAKAATKTTPAIPAAPASTITTTTTTITAPPATQSTQNTVTVVLASSPTTPSIQMTLTAAATQPTAAATTTATTPTTTTQGAAVSGSVTGTPFQQRVNNDEVNQTPIGDLKIKNAKKPVVTIYNRHFLQYQIDSMNSWIYPDLINQKKLERKLKRHTINPSIQNDLNSPLRVTKTFEVDTVIYNLKNSYINYAKIIGKEEDTNTVVFENEDFYFSVPYTADNTKPTLLYYDDSMCIKLNDAIVYDGYPKTRDYTPNDNADTLTTTRPSIALTRNIDLNSNIDFRLYTDLLGVLNKQNNGLVQADATTNIFLNAYTTTLFKTWGLVFLNYIQPSFSYSKFANQSNALNVTDSSQPLFLTDSQRVALYQLSFLQLGVKVNIAKFMFRSVSFEVNGGVNYNFSNIQLGTDVVNLKTYNTWSYFPELKAELFNTDNFGLDFNLKFLWQNTVNTNMLVYGYQDFYFIPEICMFYYPGEDKRNKIFLKLKLTEQESSSTHPDQNMLDYKRGFFSLQVGYSTKLKI